MSLTGMDRLLQRPTRTAEVTLAFDPNVGDALTEAKASRFANGPSEELDAEIARLEAELVTVTFRLRGIGASAVDEIIEAHKGDEEGQVRDSFAPALLSKVCVSIVFSDEPEPVVDIVEETMAKILARFPLDDQGRLSAEALALDRLTSAVS